MEGTTEAIKNILKKSGNFLKKHLAVIAIITIIIAGSAYVVLKWVADTVATAAREFTSEVNISNSGIMSTNISAQDLWDKMIKEGYEVDKYLDNPTELSKLLQAELVTRLPDTRSNVDEPINWDEIFNTQTNDEDEAKADGDSINVLFIGNSRTYANDNLSTCFKNLAESKGKKVNVAMLAVGGSQLIDNLNVDSQLNDLNNKLNEKKWDYIALQEQTETPISSYSTYESGATQLVKYIREKNNVKAKVIYEAWGVHNDYNESEYTSAARAAESVKSKTGGAVAYVGSSFLNCHKEYSSMSLYTDDRHPTREGTYIAACCIYNSIYGEASEGATGTFGLSQETATNIQKVADKTQKENGATTAGEILQGIIKFIRHDENGKRKSMTYADPETFNGWVNEYKSSGDENAKNQALSHFTLTKSQNSSGSSYVIGGQKGEYKETPGADWSGTYTSSTGITYKDFKQAYSKWAGVGYSGSTIGAYGCGMTTTNIILSGLGFDYTPDQLVNEMGNTWNLDFVRGLGLNVEGFEGNKSASEIADILRQGKVIAMHYHPGSAMCSSSMHFVAIVDVNDKGEFFVLDPGECAARGGSGWYTAQEIETLNYEGIIYDTTSKISSTNTRNNNTSTRNNSNNINSNTSNTLNGTKGQFTHNSGEGYSQTYISSTGFEYKDFMQWRRII